MFCLSESLICIAAFLLLGLALALAPNCMYQRPGADEPPLVAGFLPWLGVGLEMRDMEVFLKRNFAKHGPTFTAYAAGKRLVFTKDITVVQHIVKSSGFAETPLAVRSFNFYHRDQRTNNISKQDTFELAFLKTKRPVSKQETAACHRLLHSTLSGRDFVDLRNKFLVYFEHALEKCPGGEVDFFPLVRGMIFCSIS